MERVGVSLCLLGIPCRYNGKSKAMRGLERFLSRFSPIPICPEQMGGLPTPRPPSQFSGGDGLAVLASGARLINEGGEDVTDKMVLGCRNALALLKMLGAKKVFLKEKSPCCGVNLVWINGRLTRGSGLLKAMIELEEVGIEPIVGDEF